MSELYAQHTAETGHVFELMRTRYEGVKCPEEGTNTQVRVIGTTKQQSCHVLQMRKDDCQHRLAPEFVGLAEHACVRDARTRHPRDRKSLKDALFNYDNEEFYDAVRCFADAVKSGYRLTDVELRMAKHAYNTMLKKHGLLIENIMKYLRSKTESRVCIIYGLRRTGKTTMLKQSYHGRFFGIIHAYFSTGRSAVW